MRIGEKTISEISKITQNTICPIHLLKMSYAITVPIEMNFIIQNEIELMYHLFYTYKNYLLKRE